MRINQSPLHCAYLKAAAHLKVQVVPASEEDSFGLNDHLRKAATASSDEQAAQGARGDLAEPQYSLVCHRVASFEDPASRAVAVRLLVIVYLAGQGGGNRSHGRCGLQSGPLVPYLNRGELFSLTMLQECG